MISLKLTPAQQKQDSTLCCSAPGNPDAPMYPWGTELRLEDEQLKALGITTLPPVGTRYAIIGFCEVIDTSARENKEGRENCVSMQITDIQLDATGETFATKADAFYAPK